MKTHLFWLPILGVLLVWTFFPSIRYEDKSLSATIERGNTGLEAEIAEKIDIMNYSVRANPKYTMYLTQFMTYKEALDELRKGIDTAQTLTEIIAKEQIAYRILSDSKLDKRIFDAVLEYIGVCRNNDGTEKYVPNQNQNQLLLHERILLLENRLADIYAESGSVCGYYYGGNYKFQKRTMAHFDSINIAVECGTHWSRENK